MTIEVFIKAFTLLGSVLGSVAFFQNIMKDVATSNKDKWKKLNELAQLTDFDNLVYEVIGRRISGKTFGRVETLFYAIRQNDLEYTGFKSVFRNSIHEKLLELAELYEKLRTYVQVPFWNPFYDEDYTGYQLDKEVFYKRRSGNLTDADIQEAENEFHSHLRNAEATAKEMKLLFANIQRLATKDAYEYFLPWKWQ